MAADPAFMSVVNISGGGRFDVYIGRRVRSARDRRCMETSEWVNFFERSATVATPTNAVRRYERWLREQVVVDAELRARLVALDGKVLGCWCKPDVCHGDAIVRVLEDVKAGRLPARE